MSFPDLRNQVLGLRLTEVVIFCGDCIKQFEQASDPLNISFLQVLHHFEKPCIWWEYHTFKNLAGQERVQLPHEVDVDCLVVIADVHVGSSFVVTFWEFEQVVVVILGSKFAVGYLDVVRVLVEEEGLWADGAYNEFLFAVAQLVQLGDGVVPDIDDEILQCE